jgi:uncharacterized membrane protein (TIGR02234 family)
VTAPDVAGAAAEPARRPRSYLAALAALALGAGLLLVASGRTWVAIVVGEPGQPTIAVEVPGRELTYGSPLALLALAGIAGLVALRRAGRVVAGVVLLLAALGALASLLVLAATHGSASGSAAARIAELAGERAGVTVVPTGYPLAAWWLVELLGVLLVALAGVLAVVASGSWPSLGRRYERGAGTDGMPGGRGPAARPASTWEQLDQGIDPTLDADPGSQRPT